MKIEELFRKAGKLFDVDNKQKNNGVKMEKLKSSFDKKISSVKDKIKNSNSKKRKAALKKELNVLVEIRDTME